MGFTRYWQRPVEFPRDEFERFARECALECETCDSPLTNTVFSIDEVQFEGVPGCEPFRIARIGEGRSRDGLILEFCKTENLPYDEAVCACVELLVKHFPEVKVPPPS